MDIDRLKKELRNIGVDDRHAERCGVMGKECFSTKAEATAHLAAYGRRKGSKSVHKCIYGDHWHMTGGKRHNGKKGGKC